MVNNYKMNRIVGYIQQCGFEFDTDEVEEELESILAYYDIFVDLSDDELILLKSDLMQLAEEFEFAEVSYLVSQDDYILSSIPERKFSMRLERLLAKAQAHGIVEMSSVLVV